MFTPLDILYIVLAFSALWISAAIFWFVYQAARILRNVNAAVDEARDKIGKIESAITGIKDRFDTMSGPAAILIETIKGVVGYAFEKKRARGKK